MANRGGDRSDTMQELQQLQNHGARAATSLRRRAQAQPQREGRFGNKPIEPLRHHDVPRGVEPPRGLHREP